MKQNSINFKQPKYILPIVILPFLIFIAFMIKDMEIGKKEEMVLKTTEEINIDIPDANLEKRDNKTKFGALQDAFKKSSDFSGLQTIEKEEKTNELMENSESLYTTDEMRKIDSLNQITALRQAQLMEQRQRYQSEDFLSLTENPEPVTTREMPTKSRVQEEMELFKQQIAYIDSLQNPKSQQTTIPLVQEQEKPEPEPIVEVVKAEDSNVSYFNTLSEKMNNNTPITAILDETVTVRDGFRIRIRLLDDIQIGDNLLKKGNYLYGNVTGFKAQRVLIDISSVLINKQIFNINLSVFDNDGQEGFYIPASKFRELTKDIGGKMQGQSITMNEQATGPEQFAFSALQDIYTSTTQAVSKSIRQNKAKLKYSTHVYLINKEQ